MMVETEACGIPLQSALSSRLYVMQIQDIPTMRATSAMNRRIVTWLGLLLWRQRLSYAVSS
jgi:hypothetical protein